MDTPETFKQVASILKSISHPSRLEILLAIGEAEICVCHLEKRLGRSQSHISQQMMILRRAGIVLTRRENRYIHYRLSDPALLDLIHQAARLKGLSIPILPAPSDCACSDCCRRQKTTNTARQG